MQALAHVRGQRAYRLRFFEPQTLNVVLIIRSFILNAHMSANSIAVHQLGMTARSARPSDRNRLCEFGDDHIWIRLMWDWVNVSVSNLKAGRKWRFKSLEELLKTFESNERYTRIGQTVCLKESIERLRGGKFFGESIGSL